jgi:2,3-bisphosphoglycerate-independent phosphoglycerate mutase
MRKLALIVLDGWGLGDEKENNAIHIAKTPYFDSLWQSSPHTRLQASGEYVGLPEGQIGGSEVGHMTIGAGRVIYQELVRINKAMIDPGFSEYIDYNLNFLKLVESAREKQLHLVGLVSTGGVHSHLDYYMKLLEHLKRHGCIEPKIHFISDGRDTMAKMGRGFAAELQAKIDELKYGKIVTLIGRYYAMDRDKNMERTTLATDLILNAKGQQISSVSEAFEKSYAAEITDEFIEPVLIDPEYKGASYEDLFLFTNFRSDRMKQLVTKIGEYAKTENIYTLTQYDNTYEFPILFSKNPLDNTFGEIISRNKLKQLRVTETEKYAHVTYFFNGVVEITFDGEMRHLVPSNKVKHDQIPEMKAAEIAESIRDIVTKDSPDFVLVNFANPDMVGHTGNFDAVVKGVERVDFELKHLCEFLSGQGYIVCVTADHGNADIMYDLTTHEPHTAHTLNPVPFIIFDTVDSKNKTMKLNQDPANGLHKIAGTMLELMEIPESNTFESLIEQ